MNRNCESAETEIESELGQQRNNQDLEVLSHMVELGSPGEGI